MNPTPARNGKYRFLSELELREHVLSLTCHISPKRVFTKINQCETGDDFSVAKNRHCLIFCSTLGPDMIVRSPRKVLVFGKVVVQSCRWFPEEPGPRRKAVEILTGRDASRSSEGSVDSALVSPRAVTPVTQFTALARAAVGREWGAPGARRR